MNVVFPMCVWLISKNLFRAETVSTPIAIFEIDRRKINSNIYQKRNMDDMSYCEETCGTKLSSDGKAEFLQSKNWHNLTHPLLTLKTIFFIILNSFQKFSFKTCISVLFQ